jgi:hypothetical protein
MLANLTEEPSPQKEMNQLQGYSLSPLGMFKV